MSFWVGSAQQILHTTSSCAFLDGSAFLRQNDTIQIALDKLVFFASGLCSCFATLMNFV
jgi:hypothetical protein